MGIIACRGGGGKGQRVFACGVVSRNVFELALGGGVVETPGNANLPGGRQVSRLALADRPRSRRPRDMPSRAPAYRPGPATKAKKNASREFSLPKTPLEMSIYIKEGNDFF